MNDETTLHETAAQWASERSEGLPAERAEQLRAWLAADPRHARALREAEITQQLFGLLRVPAADAAPLRPRFTRKIVSFAAVALAAAAAIAFLLFPRAPHHQPQTLRVTATSQPVEQRLPDGSTISLNTAAVAAIELTSSKRRVVLAGEGYFQVAPEKNRPFSVEAGAWVVTAVGTAFTVAADHAGELKVVVTEGVVAIGRQDGTLEPQRVAAGEIARMGAGVRAPVVAPAEAAEIRAALAWGNGKVETFEAVTLGALVERFNRAGRVRLVIVDLELHARHVGGTFSTDNLDAFLALIQLDGGIRVERVSADEIRLRAARN